MYIDPTTYSSPISIAVNTGVNGNKTINRKKKLAQWRRQRGGPGQSSEGGHHAQWAHAQPGRQAGQAFFQANCVANLIPFSRRKVTPAKYFCLRT